MAEQDPHNDWWSLEDLRPFQDAINEAARKLAATTTFAIDYSTAWDPPVDRAIVDTFEPDNPGWRQRFICGIDQREIPAEGQE